MTHYHALGQAFETRSDAVDAIAAIYKLSKKQIKELYKWGAIEADDWELLTIGECDSDECDRLGFVSYVLVAE